MEVPKYIAKKIQQQNKLNMILQIKVESENEIVCKRCGKFILTEQKTSDGKIHCVKGSYENGYYDDSDNFYCLSCAKELGLE